MFFTCKVCAEKDKRIEDLKSQLGIQMCMLNKLVLPQHSNAIEREASRALDGEGADMQTEQARETEMSAVEQQALEMLTGRY